MAKTSTRLSGKVIAATFGSAAPVVVGSLVHIDESGCPFVDFPGNRHGPLAALIVGTLPADINPGAASVAVAVAFSDGDRQCPLILGVVTQSVRRQALPTVRPNEYVLDAQQLRLTAESELQLQCGTASITLRRDGKLVIKGAEVVSRASGTHKIRGGQVNIN